VERRPGRTLLTMYCASSMAPLQSLAQPGCAHSVRTSANPASLPPTETLTWVVLAERAPSWVFVTSATVAPEQARKLRVRPLLAAISEG
jgi:hypothetical protein